MHTRYIALLRGINVGGNNIIRMTDLKAAFEAMDLTDVKTYIQSGNVLFNTLEKNAEQLTLQIEAALSERFNYTSKVVLITQELLQEIVSGAPDGFGTDPEAFRYDVLFLKPPLSEKDAVKDLAIREGVDTVHTGNRVLYFSRLISKAGQSYLNKIILLPVYKQMTIRNWNTTKKLSEL